MYVCVVAYIPHYFEIVFYGGIHIFVLHFCTMFIFVYEILKWRSLNHFDSVPHYFEIVFYGGIYIFVLHFFVRCSFSL